MEQRSLLIFRIIGWIIQVACIVSAFILGHYHVAVALLFVVGITILVTYVLRPRSVISVSRDSLKTKVEQCPDDCNCWLREVYQRSEARNEKSYWGRR